MNWDDLRYILAVARAGTLADGAKALKVSPSTMTRRLRALEEEVGVALFEKWKHGAVLTEAGHEMVEVARTVEEATHALDARIRGRDARLEGVVRVTMTAMLLRRWIPDFAVFQRRHPGIELEIVSSLDVANLTQREADVAVRIARAVPEHLLGTHYAEPHLAVYGSDDLVARVGADRPYTAFPWVGWDPRLNRGSNRLVESIAPGVALPLRLGGMGDVLEAVAAGVGLGLIPCVAGDTHPALRRVGPFQAATAKLWVLTHPELRSAARVRAFLAFMRELIRRDLDLLEGRSPRAEASAG